MRYCKHCDTSKEIDEFGKKSSSKDGISLICKNCHARREADRRKTKHGVVTEIYNSQKLSSKSRGHVAPEYTLDEFREWINSQELFHSIYDSWKDGGFNSNLRPSVDRIEDNIHYRFDNIQVMSWEGNIKKYKDSLMYGGEPDKIIEVEMFSLSGHKLGEFISMMWASRITGISQGSISNCCLGKSNRAGEYVWRLKEK